MSRTYVARPNDLFDPRRCSHPCVVCVSVARVDGAKAIRPSQLAMDILSVDTATAQCWRAVFREHVLNAPVRQPDGVGAPAKADLGEFVRHGLPAVIAAASSSTPSAATPSFLVDIGPDGDAAIAASRWRAFLPNRYVLAVEPDSASCERLAKQLEVVAQRDKSAKEGYHLLDCSLSHPKHRLHSLVYEVGEEVASLPSGKMARNVANGWFVHVDALPAVENRFLHTDVTLMKVVHASSVSITLNVSG